MIKVLHISHIYPTRSTPWITPFIYNLIKAQAGKREFQVQALLPRPPDEPLPVEGAYYHTFYTLKSSKIGYKKIGQDYRKVKKRDQLVFLLSGILKAIDIVKKEGISLIHAHWSLPSGLIAAAASKITRIPYIVTAHGKDILNAPEYGYHVSTHRLYRKIIKMVLNYASSVCITSHYAEEQIQKFFFKKNKISLIPVGLDNSYLQHPVKEFQEKKSSVAFVGDLIKGKGIREALISIARREELKKIPFKIAGTGVLLKELEKIIEDCKIKNVELLGPLSPGEVQRLLCRTKILLFSSNIEAFGIIVLEALACGCLIVCSKVGVVDTLVKDPVFKKRLFIFEPGNYDQMINSLTLALKCENNKNDYLQCIEKLQQEFSWETIGDKYLELYDRIVRRAETQ